MLLSIGSGLQLKVSSAQYLNCFLEMDSNRIYFIFCIIGLSNLNPLQMVSHCLQWKGDAAL